MTDNDAPGAWLAGLTKNEEDLYTLLHTKYESSRPCSFRQEDIFLFFPIVSIWELVTPGTWLVGCIKRTTKHCYTQNMKALGLVVMKNCCFFFYVFPIESYGSQ